MIAFDNIFYGQVRIYEASDVHPSFIGTEDQALLSLLSWAVPETATASVIGFRDLKRNYVRLIKNRHGPLEDYETEQFILNYGSLACGREPEPVVVEVFEPIENRFEILDL